MTLTDRKRRIESAKRQAVSYRNYRRVRDRALVQLAKAYPETYKELLEQEKVSDVELGKKWVDIDGNTIANLDLRTSTTSSEARGRSTGDVAEAEGEHE